MRIRARLDIQKIQYMNIFERVTGVKASYCFNYGNGIIFTIPKKFMARAIGRNAININRLNRKINRRIKIIPSPAGSQDLPEFIKIIIFPNRFKRISLDNHELTIYSAPRIKAALIGRGKTRLRELEEILERFFEVKRIIIK